LEQYHATFGARIGWKWNAVLRELKSRWTPPADGFSIWDWGAGTGIATLRTQALFPESVKKVFLWDRSPLALEFSSTKIKTQTPEVTVETSQSLPLAPPLLSLFSHVITELEDADLSKLLSILQNADGVIWVEPGTPEVSRRMVDVRESLRKLFTVVAPCPHQDRCGLLGQTRDWCHHFAPPPPEAFTTAEWRQFQEALKIDLRSSPVTYLVLMKPSLAAGISPISGDRMIGRPRWEKGQAKLLMCNQTNVTQRRLLKRLHPDTVQRLQENPFSLNILPSVFDR
jgi:Mitochondrial small ribosomal subunit Rsm22